MSATTIKVEGELLQNIKKCLPDHQTVTAFVRATLEKEVRQRQIMAGADVYAKFLQENPQEQVWLEEWEAADLMRPPKLKGSARKFNSTSKTQVKTIKQKIQKVQRPSK